MDLNAAKNSTEFVVIEWYDIQDDDDWNEPGSADAFYAAHMVSSGWKIGEDKWVVVIARSYSVDESTWHEKRAIPKGCIIDMQTYEAKAGEFIDE